MQIFLVILRKLTYIITVMGQQQIGNMLSEADGGREETLAMEKQSDPEPSSCAQDKAMSGIFFVVDVPLKSLRALNIDSGKVRRYFL